MNALSTLLLLAVISQSCLSANILAIVPTASHSHQMAFMALWKELSLRGHKITLFTTDPQNDPLLTNFTEIDLKWSYKYRDNISKMVENSMNMWNIYDIYIDIITRTSDAQLSYEPVKNLIKSNQNFDVLLVEGFYPEYLGFAEIYDCPKILVASLDQLGFIHQAMGNPAHPVLNPEITTAFFGKLNFEERVLSTVLSLYMSLFTTRNFFGSKQIVLNKHFNTTSKVEELLNDVDMMFLNINPVLQGARALGPSTVTIGGYKRGTSLIPPPKDLKEFLDNAKEGFIYFSLGSNVKSKDLTKETLEAIIYTLKELPYKVLWKFEADELPGKPENVKLIKWAPQQSVLAHPNIKLFVTQGGLQSIEESIYSEVPLVVIPFFGDQEQNAKRTQTRGISITVEVRPHLNKDKLKTAILEVINNPRYRKAVRRLKHLILDTPMSGLEKAVWWTEYVIRNKGAKHLRNPAADIPFYQYYLLDVISFLIFVSLLVIYVLYVSVKFLIRFICFKFVRDQVTMNKKYK